MLGGRFRKGGDTFSGGVVLYGDFELIKNGAIFVLSSEPIVLCVLCRGAASGLVRTE